MSVHPEDMEDAMTFVRMITEDYVPKSDLRKLVERIEAYKIDRHMTPQAVNDMWLREAKKLLGGK